MGTRRASIGAINDLITAAAPPTEFDPQAKGYISALEAERLRQDTVVTYAINSLSLDPLEEQIRKLKKATGIQKFMVAGDHAGLVEKGNVNILTRPQVDNDDGSVSTVRSITIGVDDVTVVIPTVSDEGRIMSDTAAITHYNKTGEHLGKFKTEKQGSAYSKKLSAQQDKYYRQGGGSIADYLDPALRADMLRKAEAQLSARNKSLATGLTRQANDAIQMLNAGFMPAGGVEKLKGSLSLGEKHDKVAEIEEAERLQQKLAIMQSAPLSVQTEMLNEFREQLAAGSSNHIGINQASPLVELRLIHITNGHLTACVVLQNITDDGANRIVVTTLVVLTERLTVAGCVVHIIGINRTQSGEA